MKLRPGLVALHRTTLIDWQPTPIVALAATPDGTVLAAARESGDIELWETQSWHCFLRCPGRDGSCLTCLAWAWDALGGTWRLFSGSLNGQLLEWDLQTRTPRHACDSFGGAVWSLAPQPAPSGREPDAGVAFAVATDDGAVRIFHMEPGSPGLQYARTMPRIESRALSAAWHPSGSVLLAGYGDGCLRAWHVPSAREILRISAGAGTGQEGLCIWAVQVLPDGTMVSGDSHGRVQLWDANFGTLIQGFQQHKADILSIAASPSGDRIFASGIDSQLALFARVSGKREQRWAHLESKRPHTHDVRALAVLHVPGHHPLLASAGNDAQILVSRIPRFQQEHPIRVCQTPQRPLMQLSRVPSPVSTADEATGVVSPPALLLNGQRRQLDIWQLGQSIHPSIQERERGWAEGSAVRLQSIPIRLAGIETKGPCHLSCAAMSPDAQWAACGNMQALHVFRLGSGTKGRYSAVHPPAIKRMRLSPEAGRHLSGATSLAFTPHHLATALHDGTIALLDLETLEVVRSWTEARRQPDTCLGPGARPAASLQLLPAVDRLMADEGGRWVAAVGPAQVHIFDLATQQHHARLPLPQDIGLVTAAAFSPKGDSLAAATSASRLVVWDVQPAGLSRWSQQTLQHPPEGLLAMPGIPSHLSFNPDPQVRTVMIQTPTGMCSADLSKPPAQGSGRKRKRRSALKPADGHATAGRNFRVIKLEQPCLLLAFTSSSSAVLVEQPWTEIWKSLPEPMYRHRYGT
ncbi:hypothetical protein WJX84_010494 [Apatococcus fuscideae]|uniref:Uncharacterized protein n=1 Tax=Apatococcus fuscideae TaxID=2026836 RepID=A0AAW1STB6_9CHLO